MELLNEDNKKLWKDFINRKQNVPPQYLIEWNEFIEKTYKNCKSYYFIDKTRENIKTIFPFFLVKSKIFGDRLISQPFIDIGGPLGEFDNKFVLEVINALKEKFKDNVKHIEIRLNNFLIDYNKIEKCLLEEVFEKKLGKNQFILKLKDEESLWNNFNRITRKGIKKAEKSNLDIRKMDNKKEIDIFYELYLKSMKAFGTPQHSYDFFINLWKGLKNNFKGLNCYKDGKLIGSLIVLYTKDYMYAAYNFSEYEYLIYQPNDLLYWNMIKWAIKKDIKYFDFGQCEANAEKGTRAAGIYRFKSKWKADLYKKNYFYYLFNKETVGESEKQDKNKKLIKMWKTLPLPVIKKIGPRIASQLAL